MKRNLIILFLGLVSPLVSAQPLSLKQCLDYAVANNIALQKDRLGLETAAQSKREVVGAYLPQVSASGAMTYNIQKTTIAMPNFVNSMMPEAMRDPNASKYMTVTMGMDLSANWGVALSQQILNFSLLNAMSISEASSELAELGVESGENDVIAQTTTIFYNAQILEYSMALFDESLGILERMSAMMSTNQENGLVRKVDADRVEVTRMNLETERHSMEQALEVQKNLLKLQMGFPMTEEIDVEPVDIEAVEDMLIMAGSRPFEVSEQLPFRMLKQQQDMLRLQRRSAVSELLPTLSLSANYSNNYMGDHFYGETFHHFPVSMVSLNMRVPIFAGFSKNAKIKKADIEIKKALKDEDILVQSLTMGYNNARMQMDSNRETIYSQKRNKSLAQDVLEVTQSNYNEGLATLSDVLNATSSMIQAQMNYVNALNNCMKAYIDLKKADGSVKELKR